MPETDSEKAARDAHTAAWFEQCRLFPNPTSETQPGPTLPEICLAARASTDGSADPWPDSHLEATRDMLLARLATWSKGRGDMIDNAVNLMMRAAVTIITDELQRRKAEGYTIKEG